MYSSCIICWMSVVTCRKFRQVCDDRGQRVPSEIIHCNREIVFMNTILSFRHEYFILS